MTSPDYVGTPALSKISFSKNPNNIPQKTFPSVNSITRLFRKTKPWTLNMYSDLTIQNKSLLKRYSHSTRFKIALDLLNPTSEDRILDYGTGDGFMLSMIRSANNYCKIVGYEPVTHMFEELQEKTRTSDKNTIILTDNINGYTDKFNKICCLEVLEHLTENNQKIEIKRMINLLTDDGKLIISVPIEVGFSSLLKNIARILLRQSHRNTTFRNIIYSLFGIHFHRGQEPYISSHIGFYYHDLENILLSSGLKIRHKKFSPIPVLKGILNSQVFFVLKKN
jgi:2-polyprenyl-3-methyl-5-hydroxy-6-metoxy-1,4-benzoquinol methylase